MMKSRRGEAGYFLAETVAAAALFALLGSFLLQQGAVYRSYQRRLQVKTAAETLAAELRLLQQQAYFNSGSTESIRIDGDKEGYTWQTARGERHRSFASMGCEGVKVVGNSVRASFTPGGVPIGQPTYVLSHEAEPGCRYQVSVKPVTGLVEVNEK